MRTSGGRERGWTRTAYAWLVSLLAIGALALGLLLVWLNIERMDLAYEIRTLEKDLHRLGSLIAKLEVERENLMSPQRLRRIAKEMDLGPAEAGQIRRVRAGDTPYAGLNGTTAQAIQNGTVEE